MFHGADSKDNLRRIKDRAHIINLDDKKIESHYLLTD